MQGLKGGVPDLPFCIINFFLIFIVIIFNLFNKHISYYDFIKDTMKKVR